MVLARFTASELDTALAVATVWARSYPEMTLGEVAGPDGRPYILALWRNGEHQPAA